jgi:vacuolar-type H+-ATPase subunit I/STV1
MTRWKKHLLALAPLCAALLAAAGLAAAQAPAAKKAAPPPAKDDAKPDDTKYAELKKSLVKTANLGIVAHQAALAAGQVTVDRYLEALEKLNKLELDEATTREERLRALQAHKARIDDLGNRVQAEFKIGRTNAVDLSEVQLAQEMADFELLKAEKGPPQAEVRALQKRIESLEKQLEEVLKQLAANAP